MFGLIPDGEFLSLHPFGSVPETFCTGTAMGIRVDTPPVTRALLEKMLCIPPPRAAAVEFINACHTMAIAYLRLKPLDPRRFGLTREDIAYDAIAELFTRDHNDGFPIIARYVQRLGGVHQLSDEAVVTGVRRLVWSATNQEIFRMYRDQDPSLAKIIRNMKLMLHHHPTVMLDEAMGEKVVVPRANRGAKEELPWIAPELLAPYVFERTSSRSLKEILTAVGEVLGCLQDYRPAFPLVETALLVRSMYAADALALPSEEPDPSFSPEEVESVIDNVMQILELSTCSTYVRKGKLTSTEATAHLQTVRDILGAEFVRGDGEGTSYFLMIRKHLDRLTPELYRRKHRVVLEYLSRLAKQHVREVLKKELLRGL